MASACATTTVGLDGLLDEVRDDAAALRLKFDAFGVSLMDDRGDIVEATVTGLPDAFGPHYARSGEAIDPVLAHVRRTGTAGSTTTVVGDDIWCHSRLFTTVSSRYGLRGFACTPLVRGRHLVGVVNLGRVDDPTPIGFDVLVAVAALGARTSSRLVTEEPVRHRRLTTRQRQIVDLVAGGASNSQIALDLDIGIDAVKKHLKTLNQIFATPNRTAMVSASRREADQIGSWLAPSSRR